MGKIMLDVLLELALLNASKGITITTSQLGETLHCSQQTASRKLMVLEKKGFIMKKSTVKGQKITLTENGLEFLRNYYIQLRCIFEEQEAVIIKGELISGMGEGHYYVTREGYTSQFEQKLGFHPYPGTLNLLLEREHDIVVREMLDNCPYVEISGFIDEDRTFGAAKCYPVSIKGIPAAILSPLRTHHPKNIIEIISPVHLREKLNLREHDEVSVRLFT
ncbi:MAG: CTP-dependent riboflavin kinase [Theionarchaea archaeon]|nr:CTP-dependent riboflavin kinase [Theionarchaea archaeon]